ncbi:hypothetical protein Q3G72_025166 [Acer saccharum]|nr:hypothetical protein Q3G72_025166 [Acer saccharum]
MKKRIKRNTNLEDSRVILQVTEKNRIEDENQLRRWRRLRTSFDLKRTRTSFVFEEHELRTELASDLKKTTFGFEEDEIRRRRDSKKKLGLEMGILKRREFNVQCFRHGKRRGVLHTETWLWF